MKNVSIIPIAMALFLAGSVGILAEPLEGQEYESRILSDRFYGNLGGFIVDLNTTAAVGSGTLLGTIIQLENTLGVEADQGTLQHEGFWRFKRKHAIDWGYLVINRDGKTSIDEEITIGDPPVTFAVGADIATTFDMSLFKFDYRYSFVNNGKTDAGFVGGLSFFKFDLSLFGEITVDPARQTTERGGTDQAILAPVPNLGIYIDFAIKPKVILRTRAQFFDLDFGDFSGRFVDTRFTVDYFFTKHISVGGGFATTDINASKSGDDPWRIDYQYSGILLYFGGAF